MDSLILDESYPVSLESLSVIRANIQKSSHAMKLGDTNTEIFQLAATEIVTNLVKYPEKKPTILQIKMGYLGSEVIMEIYDDGSPFLEFENTIGDTENSDASIFEENTSTGGRGLMMLQMMFSRFEYYPQEENKLNKHLLANEAENIEDNKKPHVLLIDDNELDIQLYAAYLSDEYLVTSYTDPQEALTFAKQKNIELILCDINMPSMMGTEFHTQLNNISDKGSIPFIFLSANKNSKIDSTIKNLPINDSITKPIDKNNLIDVVERVLKRHKHEMNIAGTRLDAGITELIAPRIPSKIGPYSTYYKWKSSEAGGGDILFHFPATPTQKNSILIVGDIMGHGEQAKFFSISILGYLRGLLRANSEDILNPSDILNKLSDAMFYDEVLERTMLTCLVISIDKEGNGHIANAGHIPPAVIKNNEIEVLDVYGTLLGLSSDQKYDSIPFSIPDNQKAIFLTDGLLEVDKETIEVHDFLESYKTLDSNKMIEKIFTTLEDKLDDDALIAILER